MRAAVALTLLVVLPTLAPVAAAQASDEHWLNVNQPLARPGSEVAVSVNGHAGRLLLEILRIVDPTAIRGLGDTRDLGELELVESRRVDIPSNSWGDWGSVGTSITLDEAGIYLVRTTRGDVQRFAYLQASDVSFLTKAGPETGLLYAFRLPSGAPEPGARVLVNGTEVGVTGADGTFAIDPDLMTAAIVVTAADGQTSVGQSGEYAWWPVESRKVVAQFDRPIYRPGQTVHYKAIALEARNGRYVPGDDEAIRVKVSTWTAQGEEVLHEATLAPGEFGSVAGKFDIAEDAPLSHYNVQLTTSNGAQGWASIQVDAYKKPRVKLDAEPAKSHYVQGETALVRANAAWFFGAPLNRGIVEYAITASPYETWGGGCRYCFYLTDHGGRTYYGAETIASGRGELQPDGTFVVSLDLPRSELTRYYRAEIKVTAESGEQQTASASFIAHPSEYALTLVTDRYAYNRGSNLAVTATLRDHEGAPIQHAPVTLRLGEERGDGTSTHDLLTDAHGRATITLTAPATGGAYTLHASAKDDDGREAVARQWFWIADANAYWWGADGLTVIPDKESYQPGETARVLVLSTRPASVLLTVEGADLHDWRVARVDREGTFFSIPIRDEHAPGAYVVATSIWADEGTAYYGPRIDQQQSMIAVGPDARELNVTITPDKPVYRDGDAARVLVQVKDARGLPVVGEIGLGIVDASIYKLREDPLGRFIEAIHPLTQNVRTSYAWHDNGAGFLRGGGLSLESADMALGAPVPAPMSAFAMDDKAAPPLDVKVREEFPDTAAWIPFLTTDADGIARVALTAPDTLTEWRVTARAHTKDGLFGDAKQSFHTRKPLMVELSAPRFFVQGDHVNVNVVVFNHVGELRDIEVQLLGTDAAKLAGNGYKRVTLSDGDSVRIDFPVDITDDPSLLANLTVVAITNGSTNESDAMRLKLPVLPHGVVERASRAGSNDATFALPVPAGPFAAPPTVKVTVSPSMGGAVLDALPYLLGYPYGCVEQTMSRFVPAVVATRALRDAGYAIDDPLLPEYVASGLKRLEHFQHADGGWGWWEADATHPYMTAYVVAGLAEAKRAGSPVDDEMLRRGVGSLAALYAKETNHDMRAYQAYALALAGSPPRTWPSEEEVSLDGLALLGLAKLAAGDRAGAEAARDEVMAKAVDEDGRLHWEGEGVHWGFHAIRSDVQLTAHALRLLVGLGDVDTGSRVVAWLAEQRDGAAWETTKDTAESILAIVEYLEASGEASPDFEATITVAGVERRVGFHGRSANVPRETFQLDVPLSYAGGELPIEIRKDGTGRLYWSVLVSSTPRAERIDAATHGLRVEKRITDAKGNDASALAFNEEYVVRIDVTTSTERSYVMLQDVLPAGVEVVKERDLGYGAWWWADACYGCGGSWWSNVETRDDHVAAFMTTMPAGTSTLTYKVRAVHPGTYHVLPARVEAMYDPAVWGRSAEKHVTISAPPRLLVGSAVVTELGVSLRLEPIADGYRILPRDVDVELLDEQGARIALAAAPNVTLLDDGSLDIDIEATKRLPALVTVVVKTDQLGTALRRLDTRGEVVTFDGGFAPDAASLWRAGPVVAVAGARDQSPAASPDVVFQRPDEPEPVDPQPPSDPLEPGPPPRSWIPALSALGIATTAVIAALGARRRR